MDMKLSAYETSNEKEKGEVKLWDGVMADVVRELSPLIMQTIGQDDATINRAISTTGAIAAQLADYAVALRRRRTDLIMPGTPGLIV